MWVIGYGADAAECANWFKISLVEETFPSYIGSLLQDIKKI